MNKNILLTATAVAIVAALGYAAYTNGSFGDLGEAINNQVLSAVSGGVNYLSAVMSTQGLTTSTAKVAGTKNKKTEIRTAPGRLAVLRVNPKTLNIDGQAEIFKFQLTAQKTKPDIIKYIDFEIRGKGVASTTGEVIFRRLGEHTNQVWPSLKLISQKRDTFVFRVGDPSDPTSGITILENTRGVFNLTAQLLRAKEKTPLSVRILRIGR